MTFNKYCKSHNIKCPLSKLMFDYYCNLGYTCCVVEELYGYFSLVQRTNWHDNLSVLTITELKFIIENSNNKKVFPFTKIDKYINELRTSKR